MDPFLHQPLFIFAVAVFGLIIGSFLNVCIVRIPREKSVVFPPSACPKCGNKLSWYHNIPVISYLALMGKCAFCRSRISPRYPLVELLTMGAFLAVYFYQPHWQAWPFHFYLMAGLIVSTFVDLEHWIIPDVVTLPGIGIGLVGSLIIPGQGIVEHILGMLVGGGALLMIGLVYAKWKNVEGIGGGDIKLLAMAGAFLGISGALTTLILSSVLGSVIGAIVMLKTRQGSQTAIPFGPFLSLGMIASYFFGEDIIQWYLSFSHPAYGVMTQ